MSNITVHLRVICLILPPNEWDGKATHFGLQDKNGALDMGQMQPDGSCVYECEAQVKLKYGTPNFTGKCVHGTPDARFLYLSWGYVKGGWVRCIKIRLAGITQEQVEQAAAQGKALTAVVADGKAAATVKLKEAWKLD